MALIGFLDDWRPFAPLHKFALTLAVAGMVAGLGPRIHLTDIVWIDGALTALWMVWMCHAFNVLDMADGLSAGIGAIASLSLWLVGAGDWVLVIAGALMGYLAHNIHPARIYMGDAGSLLFGFLLSGMGIAVANEVGNIAGVIGPLIALGVPTFEALFISAIRFAKGRSIVRASRDHVAQRLVQYGLSVRFAVALMWWAGLVVGRVGPCGRAGVLDRFARGFVSRGRRVARAGPRGYGRRWVRWTHGWIVREKLVDPPHHAAGDGRGEGAGERAIARRGMR